MTVTDIYTYDLKACQRLKSKLFHLVLLLVYPLCEYISIGAKFKRDQHYKDKGTVSSMLLGCTCWTNLNIACYHVLLLVNLSYFSESLEHFNPTGTRNCFINWCSYGVVLFLIIEYGTLFYYWLVYNSYGGEISVFSTPLMKWHTGTVVSMLGVLLLLVPN